MANRFWPLFDLVVRTPRVEIRLPTDPDLEELAALAARGIHDPADMPFAVPWTDRPSPDLERGVLKWNWLKRAEWIPERWVFTGAVRHAGRLVGMQDLTGVQFAVTRAVGTGSWLGRALHGRGYGTEMRAAVLELAFAGLGAEHAVSEAFADNHASYAVSRKLGYRDDGIQRLMVRSAPVVGRRLRLDRAGWAAARTVPVTIDGLDECREMFG